MRLSQKDSMTCPAAATLWRDYRLAVKARAWAKARATLDVWHAHFENCPVCNPEKEKDDPKTKRR